MYLRATKTVADKWGYPYVTKDRIYKPTMEDGWVWFETDTGTWGTYAGNEECLEIVDIKIDKL
jgi:hypothetical protein